MSVSVLVVGVGNVFLGDDAFGVEVARRLAARPLPAYVTVRELGVRAFDLALALGDAPAVVLVDALARGGAPGTLYALEPAPPPPDARPVAGHALDPVAALGLARALGLPLPRLRVVGCEPGSLEPDPDLGLSPPVAAAVESALALVLAQADELWRALQAVAVDA